MANKLPDGENFGKFPYAVVRDGRWAQFSRIEAMVYGVLVAHLCADGTCWPSMVCIAELSGLSKRSVVSAVKGLEDKEVIEVEHSKGRNPNRYTLFNVEPQSSNGEAQSFTVEPPTVKSHFTVGDDPTVKSKLHVQTPTVQKTASNGEAQTSPEQRNREIQKKGHAQIVRILSDRGVTEPKLGQLTKGLLDANISPARLDLLVGMANAGGMASGWLIRKVEVMIEVTQTARQQVQDASESVERVIASRRAGESEWQQWAVTADERATWVKKLRETAKPAT